MIFCISFKKNNFFLYLIEIFHFFFCYKFHFFCLNRAKRGFVNKNFFLMHKKCICYKKCTYKKHCCFFYFFFLISLYNFRKFNFICIEKCVRKVFLFKNINGIKVVEKLLKKLEKLEKY